MTTKTPHPKQLTGPKKTTAKKSARPSLTPASHSSWLVDDVRLVFESEDYDSCDQYAVTLTTAGKDLQSIVESSLEPAVTWTFPEATLERATSSFALSQGSPSKKVSKKGAKNLPPFLVSRKTLRDLHAGSSKVTPLWGDDDDGDERTEIVIEITGSTESTYLGASVTVLRAAGGEIELWIVDDERWPLVLHRSEGECSWTLLAAGPKAALGAKHKGLGKLSFTPRKSKSTVDVERAAEAGTDALAAALTRKGTPARALLLAMKKAEGSRSPALRDALVVLLGHVDTSVRVAAAAGLRRGGEEAGFADWLVSTLHREQVRVGTDDKAQHPAWMRMDALVQLARSNALLKLSSVTDALRAIARTHDSLHFRQHMENVLIAEGDEPTRAAAIARLDDAEALAKAFYQLAATLAAVFLRADAASSFVPKIDKVFAACDRQGRGQILQTIFLNQSQGWLRYLIDLWKRSDAETRTQIAEYFVPNPDLCKGLFDPAVDSDSEMVISLFERHSVRFSALGDRTQRLLAPALLETGATWLPQVIDLALSTNGSRSWFLKMLLERHPAATMSPLLASKIEARGTVSYGDVDALLEVPAKGFVAALEACKAVMAADPDEAELVKSIEKHLRRALAK
ncbi:MAG: hypothetical protein JWP01_367 [Myxococcales bacterium]|nr:hypothetical protein [Myxococcales bacterium]